MAAEGQNRSLLLPICVVLHLFCLGFSSVLIFVDGGGVGFDRMCSISRSP
jgi:hypothetical protein